MKNTSSTLIKNGFLYTADTSASAPAYIDNAWVLIEDATIKAIGSMDEPPPIADDVIDTRGQLILPGFINPHWHESFIAPNNEQPDDSDLAPTPYSNGGNIPALGSMFGFISNIPSLLTHGEAVAIARWSLWTQLRSGTTTLGDFGSANTADGMAQAAIDLGMRIRVSRWCSDIMIPAEGPDFIRVADTQKQLDDVAELMARWNNHQSGLVGGMPTVTGTFGSSDEQMVGIKEIADQYQAPYALHLGALKNEDAAIQRIFGKSSIQRAIDLGWLSNRLMAVHTVYGSPGELANLNEAGVNICHSPGHYGMLGERTNSETGHFAKMLKDGLHLSTSTDGDINYTGGMPEALRAVHLNHNEAGNCNTVCPPTKALLTGTAYAAGALGWQNTLGSITPGKQADLLLIDINDWRYQTSNHPLRTFLLTGGSRDINTVFVAGQKLVANGKSTRFDEDKLFADYQAAAKSARQRIRPPQKPNNQHRGK